MNASGVVEVRPPPVIVDLYTPTRLVVIDGLGKPCVRTLRAVDIPGRDDFAVRIDNSERNHGMWLSRPIGFQALLSMFSLQVRLDRRACQGLPRDVVQM